MTYLSNREQLKTNADEYFTSNFVTKSIVTILFRNTIFERLDEVLMIPVDIAFNKSEFARNYHLIKTLKEFSQEIGTSPAF